MTMMKNQTPAPREAPYTLVRRSCAELLKRDAAAEWKVLPVRMDAQAVAAFRASVVQSQEAVIQTFGASLAQDANFTAMNCAFSSADCEAAWIVLMHAVDFGSGWRQELHRHNDGRGAWITIKAGVEALFHIAQAEDATNLPATWLQGLTKDRVAKAFRIHGNPDLELLADYLLIVLQDLGHGCGLVVPGNNNDDGGGDDKPFDSLQDLVTTSLQEIRASSSPTPNGDFVWMLVDRFPTTFDDRYKIHPSNTNAIQQEEQLDVCFYKKAQLVTGELYHRFRHDDDDNNKVLRDSCNFTDGDDLTAFVDNVIVACMRYHRVIVPNATLTQAIETGQEIAMGSLEEVSLRAAALCGVEAIVQGTCLSACELGNYLWAGLGKQPQVRKFARHATKTLFY